jgi:hypothetical protein
VDCGEEGRLTAGSSMKTVIAVIATVGGVLASLVMTVMLIAGAPNSSPAQMAEINASMSAVGIVGLACVVGAILAGVKGRLGLAAKIGIAPLPLNILFFIVLLVLER